MEQLRKIVILGPESTGKSTLCEHLATHYQAFCCPEFAREYLTDHGTNYSFEDLLEIAKGQLALEDSYESKIINGQITQAASRSSAIPNSLLFVDTDMHVMKVWCEFVFGKCHPFILDQLAVRKYDLYLLCKPDLPWIKDALREYPDLHNREKLYHIYRNLLMQQSTPWVEISGEDEERLLRAVEAVDIIYHKKEAISS